jgi:hypothetical protein
MFSLLSQINLWSGTTKTVDPDDVTSTVENIIQVIMKT